MKYAATFSEMANIFSTIAKTEVKVNSMIEAEKAYSKFNEEHYASFGYNFTSEQIEEQINLYDAQKKARNAAKKALKGCIEAFELDVNEYYDSILIEKCEYCYQYIDLLYALKYRAMEMTKGINIYE